MCLLSQFVRQLGEQSVRHFPGHVLGILGPHDRKPTAAPSLANLGLRETLAEPPCLQRQREVLLVGLHGEPLLLHLYLDLIFHFCF